MMMLTARRGPARLILAATAVAALLGLFGAGWLRTAAAESAGMSDPAAPGPHRVASAHYTLGDAAFQVAGFRTDGRDPNGKLADIELTGIVHYPQRMTGVPRPLVVVLHGQWQTCADTAPPAAGQWPCAKGTPALPSYRGYEYLGQNLASHGFVVVSIGANGVNAGELGDPADMARATLINKHLAMWQQLTRSGGGPLTGKFTDPATGSPRRVDFTGKVDMARVGTLGHSRGGRAVMWQAAEKHRAEWPAGVQIKAVLPLAPASISLPDDPEVVANYQLTNVPFLDWEGTCDYGAQGFYFDEIKGNNQAGSRRLGVHGANHNFLNTQWSPSSGQMFAGDDADFAPRPKPGHCTSRDDQTPVRQLTEAEERRMAAGYASAFFRRYLAGESRMDPILDGKQQPYAKLTKVDIAVDR